MSKIPVYSLPDLKAVTDESLCTYLTSLGVSQSYIRQDIRLALGYILVLIGAGTFYADYKLEWEVTREWMVYLVVAYFLFNIAFTVWIWIGEKGVVFEGTTKEGKKLTIVSRVERFDPTYNLEISTVTAPPSRSSKSIDRKAPSPQPLKISGPFCRWITADGQFATPEFQEWICSASVDIAKLESRKFVRAKVSTTSKTTDSRISEILDETEGATKGGKKPTNANEDGQPFVLDSLSPEVLQETLMRLKETGSL